MKGNERGDVCRYFYIKGEERTYACIHGVCVFLLHPLSGFFTLLYMVIFNLLLLSPTVPSRLQSSRAWCDNNPPQSVLPQPPIFRPGP